MDPVSKAQAESSQKRRNSLDNLKKGRKFQPGKSGNPGGRPKKMRITKMYEQLLASSENRKEIKGALFKTLLKGGMAPVLLLREMAERTEGKVSQPVEIDGNLTVSLAEAIQKRRKKRDGSS